MNPEAANPEAAMKQMQTKYLESVLKKMEDGGADLNATEVALGSKYLEVQRQMNALTAQANQLDNEIKFKTNELEALRDEIKREFGRAGGIMDALITLWDGPKADVPGNGAAKPDVPPEGGKEKTDA
jgi:chromosome segregation ATPase